RQKTTLAEMCLAGADAVDQQRAFGIRNRNLAEDHAAASRANRFLCEGPRRAAVSWAMIEIAISAGVFAPMASPIGPWMRAVSRSPKPRAASRSRRFAWVRVLPSAPI